MRNSPDTLAAIRHVFDQAASHITGINCCRGCTLARQIPGLLDDIAELRAEVERLRGKCTCATGDYACMDGVVWGPCIHVGYCPDRDEDGDEAIAHCECKACHPEMAVAS